MPLTCNSDFYLGDSEGQSMREGIERTCRNCAARGPINHSTEVDATVSAIDQAEPEGRKIFIR